MKLRIHVLGRWSVLKPKADVTAYEAAQLALFMTIAVGVHCTSEQKDAFIVEHGLQRHFVPEGEEA